MGKGPFKYEQTGRMSSSRAYLTGKGKMSGSHGTTGQSKSNNMSQTHGGCKVGEGTRTFKHNGIEQHSGVKNDTRHASQPKGSGK